MKKICILMPKHWSSFMGGAQFQAKCIVEELSQHRDISLHFLAKSMNCDQKLKGYTCHKIYNIPFVPFHAMYLDYPFVCSKLNRIDPDIIYQRIGGAYTGFAAHYALKNKKKMVWHIAHDDDVTSFSGDNKTVHLNRLNRRLLTYGLRNASKIIAQTARQSELMEMHYGRKADIVIPNFHPIPPTVDRKDEVFTIVWVANFKPWKNPETFIDIAETLSQSGIKHRCIMVGAPSANDEWQRKIEDRINTIPMLDYVGQLPIEQVNNLLSHSHLFVNTSLAEGFANTFIQSWMREVPVVSFHCNPDNLFNQYTLGLYASGDTSIAVSYIIKMIEDRPYSEFVGKSCREYAVKHHSLNNIQLLKKTMLEF